MQEEKAMSEKFVRLVEVMKRLRAPDGCPWDREQDYMSLRRYIIEEAYELIQAIESQKSAATLCCRWSLSPVWPKNAATSRSRT